MSGYDPMDDALDAAIDALQRGRPLDAVLYDQRPHGSALLPLLEAAEALRSAPPPPLARELPHNFAIVQAAVERARMAPSHTEAAEPNARDWWGRKLTFASLSIPAGAAALILTAGAAGATASVMTTDVGARVADAVLPAQLVDQLPGRSGDAPGHNKPDGAPSANPGSDAPGSDNRPTAISLTGTIGDINGNTFTLTNADGEWHVQIDENTEIDGEILEGATATVAGDVTAEKNLHATSIVASGGTPAVRPGSDHTPGTDGTPGANETPGSQGTPGPDKTPDSTKTPKPDKTEDSGDDSTPEADASNDEDDGDGGGN